MKNCFHFFVLSLLIVSCNKDDSLEIDRFRVNHYKQIGVGLFSGPGLVLLVQQDDMVGTDNWEHLYEGIEGFDYEWGYIYDLRIEKKTIENPPQDGSSIKYILKEIISKTQVDNDVVFKIDIKNPFAGSAIMGDISSGFELRHGVSINCSDLCEDMVELLENESNLSGTFTHINSHEIQLQSIAIGD